MKFTDACWELLRHGKPITPVGYEDKMYLLSKNEGVYKVWIQEDDTHKFAQNALVHTNWLRHDWVEYTGYVTTKEPL